MSVAATKVYRWREIERAKGKTFPFDLVPAEPSRQRILEATERGLSYVEIARLCNMHAQTVRKIARGGTARTQRVIERKIIRGLEEPDARSIADNTLVPVTDWHRQVVRSLMAQGWTGRHQIQILKQNGMGTGAIIDAMITGKPMALKRNLDQVAWLAEVIGDKEGPSRSKITMLKRGIFPLKHYYGNGKLNVRSLSREQRQYVQ